MEHVQKQTLILLLFPRFPTRVHREAFDNLLRTARLVMSREFRRDLSPDARGRPLSYMHTWVRVSSASDHPASVAIFLWIERGPLISAASSLGTLDDRVSEARAARKILVVPDELWAEVAVLHRADPDAAIFVTWYPGMAVDKTPMPKPLLLLRQRQEYDLSDAGMLGRFLGTRDRVRSPSSTYLSSVGAQDATGPPGEALRLGVTDSHPISVVRARRPSNRALEVRSLDSGRSDPRCDDEDLRDTIEPPPPSPPTSALYGDKPKPKVKL